MFNAIMTRLGYEKRADSSYTDALVAALTSGAAGTSQALPTATAALESCAGLVARAFASCEVQGPESVVKALTPDLLSMVGRALIRRGEILFSVDVTDGRLRLWPVASHDIAGDHDPSTWKYRVNLAGPDYQTSIENVSSENVIHVCYARDPERPWRGYGPIQAAILAGRLSASTAAALADEVSGPRGSFLPMPKDAGDSTTDALRSDIKSANGGMLTVESMASVWKSGESPPADWRQQRFGPSPPDSLTKLLSAASQEVMGACGLSVSLFSDSDGTGKREAWRQCLFAVIQPLGRLVETELRKKLDAPEISLSWSELRASDLQARARSFKSMVDGGMEVEKAAALSGLLLPEDEN